MARPELSRITLVTPSFNQGPFLEDTICSVLDQGYSNLEYIIVDGGSTDKSVEIIKKYERHLKWWVSEKDRGQSHAINKGFSKSTGQIHGYLNSDDLLETGALQTVAEAFQNGARWVIGVTRTFSENTPDGHFRAKPDGSRVEWLTTQIVPQQSSFWSSELHQKAGPFREDLHYVFDGEFFLRLRLKHGVHPVMIDQALAAFRFHPTSKTVSHAARFDDETAPMLKEYCKDLSISERLQVWAGLRRMRASERSNHAAKLALKEDGRGAMLSVVEAMIIWPPIVFRRATVGAARRALITAMGAGIRNQP